MIRIACCQYQIETLFDWDHYVAKVEKILAQVKAEGASILLMPEYAGTEIACKRFSTDEELFIALQPLIPKYINFYQQLAKTYQIYIQAGTIIEKASLGETSLEKASLNKFINRAYFFSPNGCYEYQDKLQLTAYEKSSNLFQKGNQQKIFETSFGKIGIAICYDSEFPEIVRRLVLHGASIILVPSYTATLAGYNRVFLSCRARAIENQCYLATAYIINKNDLSGDVDETFGQAGIFSPADTGFSDDGIIVQGAMNEPGFIMGNVEIASLDKVRREGQVHNFNDARSCHAQLENTEITTLYF